MIRKIQLKDKSEYIKMATEFYSSPAVLAPVNPKHFEDTFDLLITDSTYAECFIYEHKGEVAGYCLTAKTYSQEASGIVVWIEEIFIKESLRGIGLGSEFIEYIKANVPAKRYRLETEPENFSAQKLYIRHGFSPLEYLNYYLEK